MAANVSMPGRDPYEAVKTALRQEVGFCCPADQCGSPYLTWHHFDPPWRVENHHRVEGMIALCWEHAHKADHGAYTDDQVREMKRDGKARAGQVRGRFDWMRRELLARVGGNFYYETPVIFQVGAIPCVWFDRDDDGYLLLNFRMPTLSGEPRASIEQNFWSAPPGVEEIVCPPSGRIVSVRYQSGDQFRAEFFSADTPEALIARYPGASGHPWASRVRFPLTVVEVWETAAGSAVEFGPHSSRIGGINMTECVVSRSRAGIMVEASQAETARLFAAEPRPTPGSAPRLPGRP